MSELLPTRLAAACATALLALALLAVSAPAAVAETIVVSTTADTEGGSCTPTSGTCSLREAVELIAAGETEAAVTIELTATGTIDVGAKGELDLDFPEAVDTVEIAGPGAAQLTISGGEVSRVFRVDSAASFLFTGLTIADGLATGLEGGGGILVAADAQVALEAVRMTANSAPGSRSGGAILLAAGGLTVTDSSFSGNSAGEYGGAVGAEAPTAIERSSFDANSVPDVEGGEGGGGAIALTAAEPLLLRDSTVTANSGGGIYGVGVELTIRNSTIVANTTDLRPGAGIEAEQFVIQSTVLDSNLRGSTAAECTGTGFSQGNNLVGSTAGCGFVAAGSDLFGVDPQLGPLGDYGGPTQTMPPVSRESPAINAGENPQPTDQRGRTRPVPGSAADTDIGAVEVQAPDLEVADPPAISPATGLKTGDTLTCEAGTWDTDTVTDSSFAYVWRVDGDVAGSGLNFELGNKDAGQPIVCEVTVDNGVLAASATTSPVQLQPALAVVTPAEFDFGSRRVGTGPSAPQALVVENQGGADLEVTGASTTNTEFPIDAGDCDGAVLSAGQSCEVEASFEPVAPGQQGSFVIVTTTAGSPVATLSGKATDFSFSADPASVDFGTQRIATTSAAEEVVVSNLGDAPMGLDQVTIGGADAADFALGANSCAEATVQPGGECTVEVTFTPGAVGGRAASLAFSGDLSVSIPLFGTGIAPALTIAPAPLGYGSHLVGTKSAAQVFTVTNVGAASATLGTVALAGANPGQFELGASDTCTGATLAPAAECSVNVTFAPTVVGAAEAVLQVPSDAPTATSVLTGTAFGQPEFAADPLQLDFGPVRTDSGPSAAETVTVSNEGTAAMEIDSVTIEGADAAVFAIVSGGDSCAAATLDPGEECEVEVTFDPSEARGFSATLAFAGDDPGTVGLFGTGIAPALTIAPAPLGYGSHLVGTKSGAQVFTVTNVGAASATLGSVALAGANPGQFELGASDTCTGATLAPAAECAVEVTFAPTVVGAAEAVLQVPSDAPTATSVLTGTGTEPGFSAAPSSFDFGILAVEDAPSPAETILVTNSGTGAMEIGPIFLAGTDPGMFALEADGCSGQTLAPGADCEVDARFVPTGAGEFAANIVFPGTSPGTVALEGTGIAPSISVTPGSADFGSRQVGSGPGTPQTVTVKNEGTASLALGALELGGLAPTSFAILAGADNCSGKSLAPSQSCTVQVVFAPLVTGDLAAELTIPGNAPGLVILHGFGSAAPPPPAPPAPEPPPAPAPRPALRLAAHKGPLLIESSGLAKVALVCDSPSGVACKGTVKVKLGKQTVRWRGKIAAGAGRWALFRFGGGVRKALAKKGKLRGQVLLSSAAGKQRVKATFKLP